MVRTRRVIGLLTLLVLVAIAINVSGVELPVPRLRGSTTSQAELPGVRAVTASTLVKVGAGAPVGGELAFMTLEPTGNLVVSDARRRTVIRFDATGHMLSEWGPRLGDTDIGEPAGVAVTGESFYVMDRGEQPRILRLDSAGQLQATFNLQPLSPYGLNGLAIDVGNNIYAADTGRNRILVFSPTGQLIKQVGHSGNDLGGFTQPMMLAFGPDGAFYVADWENSRVERWDAGFEASNAWPTGFHPFGIAVDAIGRVFVPDADHRRVEVYSPQGAALGEMGAPGSPAIDVVPRQVAVPRTGPPSLYVLGGDGIQRLDLENTAPPPQAGPGDGDVLSLFVIALMVALVAVALLSRRQRRASPSLHATSERPIGLHAENGTQRQQQEPNADQNLLIAHQPKGEQ